MLVAHIVEEVADFIFGKAVLYPGLRKPHHIGGLDIPANWTSCTKDLPRFLVSLV